MKKQVLSALALCTCLGVAQAQTDVTGEYLVNPSFETLKAADGTTDVTAKTELTNGLYGWEIPDLNGADYRNREVDSEASGNSSGFGTAVKPSDGTYYYFNRKGWIYGTMASELKTTTSQALPAGNYYVTIDYKAADYSNENNANNNGTTINFNIKDASGNELGGNEAVRRARSEISQPTCFETDAWEQLGAMFTVTESSVVTIALQQNMKNSGRSDIIYDNMKLYKIENLADEGMDVSGLIANSNDYALAGWTIEGGNTFQVNTWSTEGNTDGSGMTTPFIQDWVGKGTNAADANMSYTLNNLIPGVYEVSGLIRVLNEAGGASPAGATLYANEGTTDACAGTACTNGVYGTYTVKGTVTADGTLKFGIEVKNANFNWVSFKNFTLKYLGEAGADELKAALNAQLTEAKTYVEASPAAVKDMLENAITAGETAASGDDTEAINAAIEALGNAIEVAKVAIPAVEALEAELPNAQIFMDVTAYQDLIENGTDRDAFANASQNLYADEYAQLVKLNSISIGNISEWGGDMVMNKGQHWSGNGENQYAEQTGEQWGAGNWNVYKETSVTLPAGKYVLTATGRASAQATLTMSVARKTVTFPQKGDGGYGVETDGTANLTADGTYANNGGRGWEYRYCAFELDAEQEVTIRIEGSAVEKNQWVSISDVALYSVETNVTLNITGAGWATLILPFEAEVPVNVTAYTCGAVGEVQDGVATLTLAEADKLEANTPYILQGTDGTYSFKGLSVATEDSYTVGLLTGTLVDMLAKEGTYVLQNQDSGVGFYKVGSDSQSTQPEIGAYRAYLNADAVAGGNVQAFILKSIDGDGTTTGIDGTVAEADATVNVYNLNGILVRQNVKMGEALDGLQKGIYIVNGTKKAVK